MGRVWATMNLKGGVGKTTLTANICRALCQVSPLRVLIVDTDPQCSLTLIFKNEGEVDQIAEAKTFYDILCRPITNMEGKVKYCKIGLPFDGLGKIDLIPSHVQVIQPMITAMMESVRPGQSFQFDEMKQNFHRFLQAAKAMYDLVVLDTNPSGNIATYLSIMHADHIISPVTADRFAIRGISLMRRVFSNQFVWLQAEPYRLVPILNNIKDANEAADVRAQLRQGAEEGLEENALVNWVPQSRFLGYSEKKKGFVHERKPIVMNIKKHRNLCTQLESVARELKTKTGLP